MVQYSFLLPLHYILLLYLKYGEICLDEFCPTMCIDGKAFSKQKYKQTLGFVKKKIRNVLTIQQLRERERDKNFISTINTRFTFMKFDSN